jgi:hypothetical protein
MEVLTILLDSIMFFSKHGRPEVNYFLVGMLQDSVCHDLSYVANPLVM